MKKNLKIVSAAAAALLAVAPVVATGVAAHADIITSFNNFPGVNNNSGITVGANVNGVMIGGQNGHRASNFAVSGSVTATLDGHTYTGNLSQQKVNVYEYVAAHDETHHVAGHPDTTVHVPAQYVLVHTADMKAGHHYYALVKGAQFSLGANNTNKHDVKLNGADNVRFINLTTLPAHNGPIDKTSVKKSAKVSTDAVGTTSAQNLFVEFSANDISDARAVGFVEQDTGRVVTSGDITLNAGNNGSVNLGTVLSSALNKYAAAQWNGNNSSHIQIQTNLQDLISQAKKAGLTVDGAGYVENAPKTMHFTLSAKSDVNGVSATLPLTVNVPNGKETTNTDEYAHTTRVWNKKASYIYNSNHDRLANGLLYKVGSGHNVVANADGSAKEYHVGGIVAYKLADGHYKGNYVDVRNFSSHRVESNKKVVTTRARIFTASGRVVGKHNYVNAGVRVKVSGTKTIKGHKMYRIATNRYIKAANVRNA